VLLAACEDAPVGCDGDCIVLTPPVAADAGAAGDTLPVSHNNHQQLSL